MITDNISEFFFNKRREVASGPQLLIPEANYLLHFYFLVNSVLFFVHSLNQEADLICKISLRTSNTLIKGGNTEKKLSEVLGKPTFGCSVLSKSRIFWGLRPLGPHQGSTPGPCWGAKAPPEPSATNASDTEHS